MNKIFSIIAGMALGASALTSCNEVSEPDRTVPADIQARRTVLIEEFTGQRCTNCPDGHQAIHNLKASPLLGDSIIAVGIHASGLAMNPPVGFKTETGEEYYRYFGSPALPTAILNMATSPLVVELWTTNINRLIVVPTDYTVRAEATYSDDGTITVNVATSAGEDFEGHLQVWITEDDIVAYQLDHGTNVNDYEHNHVFRAAVNGTWGEEVSLKAHTPQTFNYTYQAQSTWKPANLNIVAFLYNDAGVAQATETAVK